MSFASGLVLSKPEGNHRNLRQEEVEILGEPNHKYLTEVQMEDLEEKNRRINLQ